MSTILSLNACAVNGSYGIKLNLIPCKLPIIHGVSGVMQGGHDSLEDRIYYHFVPHCKVLGSVHVDNTTVDSWGR